MDGITVHQPRYRYVKLRWKLLFRAFDWLTEALPSAALQLPIRRFAAWPPERILLVQLDHVGDAVLSTGIPAVLKERFPHCRVDVLCSQWNAELFRALPEVDQCLVSRRNWHGRSAEQFAVWQEIRRLVRLLRPRHYDVGVDIRGDFPTVLILWLAGIPWRIGWDCAGGQALLATVARWRSGRHELQNRRELLKLLGIEATLRPRVCPKPRHRRRVRELLRLVHALPPLVAIHVGAGTPAKRWPTHYYHELICELHERLAATCILVGGPADRPIAQRLDRMGTPACNWVGRLSLLELAALCQQMDVFIGPDSGPAHIAAATGTPTIVLFSGTNHVSQWAPVGPHVIPLHYRTGCAPCCLKVCNQPAHPCMSGITPDTVARIVARVLLRTTKHLEPEQRPEPVPLRMTA